MTFTIKGKSFDYDNKKVYSEQTLEELRQEIHQIVNNKDGFKSENIDFAFGVLDDIKPEKKSKKKKEVD